MLEVASLVNGNMWGSVHLELAVDCMKLTDYAVDDVSNIAIDDVKEVDFNENLEFKKRGLKLKVKDAEEIDRGVLQKVDPDFLWSNELKDGRCQDVINKYVRGAEVNSNLHSKISLSVQVFYFAVLLEAEAIFFGTFFSGFYCSLVNSRNEVRAQQ